MKINNQSLTYVKGTSLKAYLEIMGIKDAVAAHRNYEIVGIDYLPNPDDDLFIIDRSDDLGKEIYEKTLVFVFIKAVKQCYKDVRVVVRHSISSGLFCTLEGISQIDDRVVLKIENGMKDLIAQALPIKSLKMDRRMAIDLFTANRQCDEAELLKTGDLDSYKLYYMDGDYEFFQTPVMLPNTSDIHDFAIQKYAFGIWLSQVKQFQKQDKLLDVFNRFEFWGKLIGVNNVAGLNRKIEQGEIDELVLMSEIAIEEQLFNISRQICVENQNIRFILIAGPSSAGKTTFSRRLALHMKFFGKQAIPISMDDFYKNRVDTPKLPDGSYDFESPEAIDLDLFKSTILTLLKGEECKMPRFDFKTGERYFEKDYFTLKDQQCLIIEGIHGLNPIVSEGIPKEALFKIYINALTHLNLDDHNSIGTSEYRLIRRMVRDHQFRNYPASETIRLWKNVRDGEDKYIYPYQENADVVFNSSMIYELAILKQLAFPLLKSIDQSQSEYLIAKSLLDLLQFIQGAKSDLIPRTSILAEFIGNSYFDVH